MGFFVNIKEGDIYFNPKISIIIAAYNQEKNIEKCLNSIVTQSYKNLEIIIINDGSTDNTNFICEDFFKYDKRIKLIYQNNGGLSRARNTGLKNMTGDYVTFVDADDYIDSDLILNYVKILTSYRDNILISGYRNLKLNKVIYIYIDKFNVLSLQQALKLLFEDESFRNFMCNKLYPSNFFKNIKFDDGKNYEDIRIQYKLFELSKKIVVCPFVGYNYIYYQNSISNSKKHILDFVDAQIDRLQDIYNTRKNYEFYPLLSIKLFVTYISKCNTFYLREIQLLKNKKIITYKLKKIEFLLRKNLPRKKYFILMIALKNNMILDLIIYIVWNINIVKRKIINKLHSIISDKQII